VAKHLSLLSGPVVGPTHSTIQWLPLALLLRVKQTCHEADHWLPCTADVKNGKSYTSGPCVCLHGKYRDNFTSSPYQGSVM